MSIMIYEPAEDSYLLQKHIKKYAKGKVLDMGTGSGIQAREAKKYTDDVTAADINPQCRADDLKFVETDLFSNIDGKFDLITFNPPYLPNDARVKDIALDGGKHGYEVIERFLDTVNPHFEKDGKILLLFSSLSKKDKVEEFISRNCLQYEEIDRLNLDFEVLYIYLIEKQDLLKELETKGVSDVKFFAKGKRGYIYKGQYEGRKVAVKAQSPESEADRIGFEVKYLEVLNKHDIGPQLLFSGKDYFCYVFVESERIVDYIEKAEKKDILKVFREVFRQLHVMDELGISKEEMHHPVKHVLVGEKVVLIDFERAHYTEKPQNITQFCQFMIELTGMLRERGIIIDKDTMIDAAKRYSENHDMEIIWGVLDGLQ